MVTGTNDRWMDVSRCSKNSTLVRVISIKNKNYRWTFRGKKKETMAEQRRTALSGCLTKHLVLDGKCCLSIWIFLVII